jgi:hypothetical protein
LIPLFGAALDLSLTVEGPLCLEAVGWLLQAESRVCRTSYPMTRLRRKRPSPYIS